LWTNCGQTHFKPLIHNGFCSSAKGVDRVTDARVQIPASPLKPLKINASRAFSCLHTVPFDSYKSFAVVDSIVDTLPY